MVVIVLIDQNLFSHLFFNGISKQICGFICKNLAWFPQQLRPSSVISHLILPRMQDQKIWTAYLEVPWMQGWELHCGCPPGAILFHSQYGLCNSHWEKKSYKCECSSSPLDYPKFVPLGSLGGDYIYKKLQCRNRTAAWDWPTRI